jgi:hypothetical protein
VTSYNSEGLFIPWDGNLRNALQEIVYGMNDETTSINTMDPETFANIIRDNEQYSNYFYSINGLILYLLM